MPSTLPLGDPAPADGLLPASAADGAAGRDFGVYLHVPFCRVRCGYCDFNTYTATELRGISQSDYAGHAVREVEFAARALEASGLPARPVSTVFFGGGTPTLLPPGDLGAMLGAVRDAWGLAPGAEVTTEANPDSVDADDLRRLLLITVNGVRVMLEDGTWGLVRASSNKPELVVVVESPTSEANMKAIFKDIDQQLSRFPEVGEYNQKIAV